MTTRQPQWKNIGHLGDVDPIAHGGGFVYVDETGVYPPEVTWFEPAPDEDWHKTEGATPVEIYRFNIMPQPKREWWYDKLDAVAESCGQEVCVYIADVNSQDLMARARVYEDLIHYHGAHNFDSYPITMTEDECYAKYAQEMANARRV